MTEREKNMATIVLVDDDRDNARLIQILLEMDGFSVMVFPDVKGAIVAAEPDIGAFVIDCNLAHGGDGVDLLRAIRRGDTKADNDLPVILTSGDDRRSIEAENAGATSFLLKPYSPSALSVELSQLIK